MAGIFNGDVVDRYDMSGVPPIGLRTGYEGKESWQSFESRVSAAASKSPDKTFEAGILDYARRRSVAEDKLRNNDIAGATSDDEGLVRWIQANRQAISAYSGMDTTMFPANSTVAKVKEIADSITNETELGKTVTTVSGDEVSYGVLRNKDARKALDDRRGGALDVAGYGSDAIRASNGDVWFGFDRSQEWNPSERTGDQKYTEMVASCGDTYRKTIGYLTAPDLALSGKNGVNFRIDEDSQKQSRIARIDLANEICSDVQGYWNAFGQSLPDMVKSIHGAFNGIEAKSMMRSALIAAKSSGLTGRRLVDDVTDKLRELKGAMRKSDSVGQNGGGKDEYSQYEQSAALYHGLRALSESGVKVDLADPRLAKSVTEIGSLTAELKASGIDPTKLLRDKNVSVGREYGSQVARSGGLMTPTGVFDVLRSIRDFRPVRGASSFRAGNFPESTSSADHSSRDRRNGGMSDFRFADDLATEINDVSKRHLADAAVSYGVGINGAAEKINGSFDRLAAYSDEMRRTIKRAIPGTDEERNAATELFARAVSGGSAVDLVDFATRAVKDPALNRDNNAAVRGLRQWLSAVRADDPEMKVIRDQVYAKYLSRGVAQNIASADTVRYMADLEKEKIRGGNWMKAANDFIGQTRGIVVSGNDRDGFDYVFRDYNLEDYRGKAIDIGKRQVQIPLMGFLGGVSSDIEMLSRELGGSIDKMNYKLLQQKLAEENK